MAKRRKRAAAARRLLIIALLGVCAVALVLYLKSGGSLAPEDAVAQVEINEVMTSNKGAVPDEKVERALALSRDKYCSVWHSMRQDIPFTTSFTVVR